MSAQFNILSHLQDPAVRELATWLENSINVEHLLPVYAKNDIEFSLAEVERLCTKLHHPELAINTVHVAGSKGKGSVSCFIASILQETTPAHPVGIFASPHITDFRERITTPRGFFPDEIYCRAAQEMVTQLRSEHQSASWFELVFAYAATCFRIAHSSHAVYEVGMGGRLDATNIIKPQVCAITRIELEHTRWLGNTLKQIAFEKAGIINPDTPVVIAKQSNPEVEAVFRQIAAERSAPLYYLPEHCTISQPQYETDSMVVEIESPLFRRPLRSHLRLFGSVQAENAAQAAIATKLIHPDLDESIIERGLERAILPGRFERQGNLIFDAAHTPSSLAQLLTTLSEVYPHKTFNLLFACAADKDMVNMVPLLKNRFQHIFITRPGDFKRSELAALEKEFQKNSIAFNSNPDYHQQIQRAISSTSPDEILVVTGSMYLISEVKHSQQSVI